MTLTPFMSSTWMKNRTRSIIEKRDLLVEELKETFFSLSWSLAVDFGSLPLLVLDGLFFSYLPLPF
jgi:hypothetical protein